METMDVIQSIRARRSVRSYRPVALTAADRQEVEALMGRVSNPFGERVRLHLMSGDAVCGEKVGTYGVIRGAKTFVGVSAPLTERAPLAVGYQFEQFILGATALGLATVWLGGTFKRSRFAQSFGLDEEAWLAAVSPVGYEAAKRSTMDAVMRHVVRADEREAWRDLFTLDGFQIQLDEDAAGAYALPLEMLRLAPSGRNAQPWRVVKKDKTFYFYETHRASVGENEKRLKQVDLGIAIAHFHLTARQLGLRGHFEYAPLSSVRIPEDTFYHLSWVAE